MAWDTKTKIKVGVAGVAVVLFSIAGIMRLTQRVPTEVTPEKSDTTQPESNITGDEAIPKPAFVPPSQPAELPQDTAQAQTKRFSMDFAARYGTFSTDAPNENLRQLVAIMTGDLKTTTQERLKTTPTYTQFLSVNTRALSAQIISETTVGATVAVKAQRVYRDAGGTRVTYETATLALRRSLTGWVVERAVWNIN